MRKSRCCASAVWRFGERRRRCSRCKRTWRVWKKKLGRPNLRNLGRLLQKVFVEHRTLTQLAKAEGVTPQAFSYRFLKTLSGELERGRIPSAALSSSNRLILLADGLWFKFKRRPWVLYVMALRPVNGNTATFVDPFLLRGRESPAGWAMAFRTIPAGHRRKIRALVVDNFSGSVGLSRENGWLLQLCNFHLLATIRNWLGTRHPRYVGASKLRFESFRLIRRAVRMEEGPKLDSIRSRLAHIAGQPGISSKFADRLREFNRRSDNYRAYRLRPSLGLPWTNSSLESAGAKIRRLMRRLAGLRTPRALRLWSTTYLRISPTIRCNPG